MAVKTYKGSCHCGTITYEADVDLSKGTNRCNCSICTKTRAWFVFVKADNLRMVSGKDTMADYQWTPPGKPHPFLHYNFCKTCGVRAFARGEMKEMGGAFYALAVASLDDVDPDELAAAPIKYVDGRHDQFDKPPTDTRLM
jgi:hypothetical protein